MGDPGHASKMEPNVLVTPSDPSNLDRLVPVREGRGPDSSSSQWDARLPGRPLSIIQEVLNPTEEWSQRDRDHYGLSYRNPSRRSQTLHQERDRDRQDSTGQTHGRSLCGRPFQETDR